MADLCAAALAAIQKHQMLKNGDTVIVACSGGADSMALFRFLLSQREALGITVRAAHVDHGLRGVQSAADAAFVRSACARYGVSLDEAQLTPPEKAPGEAWARRERYAFFRALAQKWHAKVATAHTRDDQAETVLLNLARGAGIHGAAGIPPVRDVFIRPLLDVPRTDIEAYLTSLHQPFCTDATNLTDAYARNRVRHTLLPALDAAHRGAGKALARFATHMADTAAYLDAQAATLLQEALLPTPYVPARQDPAFDAACLCRAPAPVCFAALRTLVRPHADPTEARLTLAEEALHTRGAVQLSKEAVFTAAQGVVRVQPAHIRLRTWHLPLREGWQQPAQEPYQLGVQLLTYEEFINFSIPGQNRMHFYADYDKIQDNPVFRTRRAGDAFHPQGRSTKSVKDLYSEAKLSALARASLPVLACGGTVLWIQGFGFAQELMPSAHTKMVVSIEVKTKE